MAPTKGYAKVDIMLDELHQTCRRLLEEETVRVVIGYGQSLPGTPVYPVFITRPEEVEQLVWNDQCFANLAKYLLRKEIRALGRPAIVVKGCDQRSLVVLEVESQVDRSQIVVIGMACPGVGQPRLAKCEACDVHMPRGTDITIGRCDLPAPADGARYAALASLEAITSDARMAYWQEEFSRCVKCYACRQVCPMCYCERCIAEKNRPQVISTSPTGKGNFAWHITRAFHLAGRCVGCDECTRACPAGIDLRLLNLSMAKAAEEEFDFQAGVSAEREPVLGTYSLQDKEGFIR